MIRVYHGSPCPYGRKVLAVLKEKDLDYEIRPVCLAAREHETPEFLKLNPNGEVPVIEDEGVVVYESSAIAEYLDEEYPEPPLMPSASEARARVRMVHAFCDLHFYRAVRPLVKKTLFEKQPAAAKDREAAVQALARLGAYLGGGRFIAGDFSLADCAVMPVVPWIAPLELSDTVAAAGLAAYFDRLKKRRGYEGASHDALVRG